MPKVELRRRAHLSYVGLQAVGTGPDYPLCRLYHGRGSRRQGAPDQLQNVYHAVLTLNVQCMQCRPGLNVTTTASATTKKSSAFLGEETVSLVSNKDVSYVYFYSESLCDTLPYYTFRDILAILHILALHESQ